MKQDFENQIANRLADYKRQAPEGLLESVRDEMSRRAVAGSHGEQRRPRAVALWAWRVAGVAAMVAIAVLVGRELFVNNDATQLAKEGAKPSAIAEKTETDNITSAALPADEPSLVGKAVARLLGKGSAQSGEPMLAMGEDEALVLNENPVVAYQGEPSDKESGLKEQKKDRRADNNHRPQGSQLAYSYKRENGGGGLSLGAYYSGAASASSGNGNDRYVYSAFMPLAASNVNANRDFHEESHHHSSPVKVGVQARYNINERWSVQSGATYTQLTSDFSEYDSRGSRKTSRKMHFVGVPVGVSYSVYRSKRFNVYLAAGGEAQKMVSGKDKIETTDVGKRPENSTSDVSMGRLQLSANAAVGAEVNVGSGVSVYAEPGATYYLNNSSGVESYYSEHPMKLSLNVGVRFNINK